MKIAIIDFETTGLDPKWNEIIEIGCVVFDDEDFVIQKTLDIKVNPIYPQRISKEAQKVNGYSDEEWLYGVERSNALSQLTKITKGTHFASFNLIFDRSEERRVGKECRSRWSPYH